MTGESGAVFVSRLLAEGSLVGFVRSDPMLFHYRGKNLKRLTELNSTIPHVSLTTLFLGFPRSISTHNTQD